MKASAYACCNKPLVPRSSVFSSVVAAKAMPSRVHRRPAWSSFRRILCHAERPFAAPIRCVRRTYSTETDGSSGQLSSYAIENMEFKMLEEQADAIINCPGILRTRVYLDPGNFGHGAGSEKVSTDNRNIHSCDRAELELQVFWYRFHSCAPRSGRSTRSI